MLGGRAAATRIRVSHWQSHHEPEPPGCRCQGQDTIPAATIMPLAMACIVTGVTVAAQQRGLLA